MGVKLRLRLLASDEDSAWDAARAVFARADEIDFALSDYRVDGELKALERSSGPFRASADLYGALELSLDVAAKTEGAFDPTVGPIVKLWRDARRDGRRPDPGEIAKARSRIDRTAVRLSGPDERTVHLARADLSFDFGGIGKGIALDAAAQILRSRGIDVFLLEFGGEILVGDPPSGKDGWVVDLGDGEKTRLSNEALSTSGDAEQFVVLDGVRYSHVIDPRNGEPLSDGVRAIVRARSSAEADALSTALSVIGAERFFDVLARFPGVSARIETGSERHRVESVGFLSAIQRTE